MVLHFFHHQLVEVVHLRDCGLSPENSELFFRLLYNGRGVTVKALQFAELLSASSQKVLPEVVVLELARVSQKLPVQRQDFFEHGPDLAQDRRDHRSRLHFPVQTGLSRNLVVICVPSRPVRECQTGTQNGQDDLQNDRQHNQAGGLSCRCCRGYPTMEQQARTGGTAAPDPVHSDTAVPSAEDDCHVCGRNAGQIQLEEPLKGGPRPPPGLSEGHAGPIRDSVPAKT
ncbi:hypothetical protein KL921_003280 [Ogataea angusta]|nr:hypothetical protein KL921_003280 [Ogataea angusta]